MADKLTNASTASGATARLHRRYALIYQQLHNGSHPNDRGSLELTVASASSSVRQPVALLIFDMQPEQEAEHMIENQWLPAAGKLASHADFTVARTPDEVSRHLAGGLRPEIVFLFAETGWGYSCLQEHKLTLLARGLRWVQAASSGAEKLCPIWRGTDVTCTNGAGIYASSLAEFVMAGILHFSKHFPRLVAQRRTATWQMRSDEGVPPQDIDGKTALIVGYGATGKATAQLCKAFGVRTIGVKRSIRLEDFAHADEVISPQHKAGFREALAEADFVVCALPQTEATHHFFAAAEFAAMKPSGIFINVGRGDNVDEDALVAALSTREIAACCLDVFEHEPLPQDSKLWHFSDDRILLSPIAGSKGCFHIYLSCNIACNGYDTDLPSKERKAVCIKSGAISEERSARA